MKNNELFSQWRVLTCCSHRQNPEKCSVLSIASSNNAEKETVVSVRNLWKGEKTGELVPGQGIKTKLCVLNLQCVFFFFFEKPQSPMFENTSPSTTQGDSSVKLRENTAHIEGYVQQRR